VTEQQLRRHCELALDEERLFERARTLVGTYGPTYAEQQSVQALEAILQQEGLPYRRQRVGAYPGRWNLIVEVGPQPPAIQWVGHLDTVPFIDEVAQRARVEGNRLIGLGSCDMKASCVAALEGLQVFLAAERRLTVGVRLAFVVGEEDYGDGAATLTEEEQPPLTVVGEPTGLYVCLDHCGYLECLLRSTGSSAHAAFPQIGTSAVLAMFNWIDSLLQAGTPANRRSGSGPTVEREIDRPEEEGPEQPWSHAQDSGAYDTENMAEASAFSPPRPEEDERDEALQPTINVREIRGGTRNFVVPDVCEVELDMHVGAGVDQSAVERFVERSAAAAKQVTPEAEFSHDVLFWSPGYSVPDDARQLDTLRSAFECAELPWRTAAFPSHSDAPRFQQAGSTTVVCGPGDLSVAHTAEEYIALDQLTKATRLYAALFCSALSHNEPAS